MYTHTGFVGLLVTVHLIVPLSGASAQTARGDVEMMSGDVWQSDAERIYMLREAYMPREVFEWHGASRD
jgi:hypothetical protein